MLAKCESLTSIIASGVTINTLVANSSGTIVSKVGLGSSPNISKYTCIYSDILNITGAAEQGKLTSYITTSGVHELFTGRLTVSDSAQQATLTGYLTVNKMSEYSDENSGGKDDMKTEPYIVQLEFSNYSDKMKNFLQYVFSEVEK